MTCLQCGRNARNHGRGLCRACHRHLSWSGGLEDYPRGVDARAEDIAELDARRLSARQIAARLGVSDRTVYRHRTRMRLEQKQEQPA